MLSTSSCGDHSEHHEPFAGGTALRIIGIYETDAPHDTMGDIRIEVDLDHDVVLVFTSYEGARWTVVNNGPGRIERVIVNGYNDQEVVAPAGVPVEDTGRGSGSPYWGSAYDWHDIDAREVADGAEGLTGLPLTSFHGCYQATEFTLTEGCDGPIGGEPLDCEADGVVHGGPDETLVASLCPAVADESYYCLTVTSAGELAALGLDTGSLCVLGRTSLPELSHVSSIAWLDDYLYACGGPSQRLARVSLRDGSIKHVDVWCEAVAAYGHGLLVEPSWAEGPHFGEMWLYPTFLRAQCADADLLGVDHRGTRITVWGDTLYSAWHSTGTIDTIALPRGPSLGEVTLEGYDTWVDGMSVIDGDLLVVSASSSGGRVVVFDADDGHALWEVPVSGRLHGLSCVRGR